MVELIYSWPPSILMPNAARQAHWTKKSPFEKAYRQECLIRTGKPQPTLIIDDCFVPIEITFYPPDKRHRDLDGLLGSVKLLLDALAQGIGINDRNFRPITLDVGPVLKGGRVVVKI